MVSGTKPVPCPTPETQAYWEGCRHGELRLQRCANCGSTQFPPRHHCADCLADELHWEAACGRGRIASFTIVRHPVSPAFAADTPYVVALVQLEEGPTMMADIRGCDPNEVAVGMSVEVGFDARSTEIHVPYFRPFGEPVAAG